MELSLLLKATATQKALMEFSLDIKTTEEAVGLCAVSVILAFFKERLYNGATTSLNA